MIRIGEMNACIVMRKSDLGYMLVNKEEQVLLHFKQALDQELEINSMVECFVQYDSKGRISATLEKPTVTMSKPGWGTVLEANARSGIFVSINTFKDLFISKDDLPQDARLWPEAGDKVFIKMFENKGRLNAKLVTKSDLLAINPEIPNVALGSKMDAYVMRSSNVAVNAITENGTWVYISSKQFRGTYRLGQKVEVMIIGAHEDELCGSLNKVKEELVESDEEMILQYMRTHNNEMPYTSKSSAEVIEEVFHMSRKAFKRALGDLYKNRKVICEEDKTVLVK